MAAIVISISKLIQVINGRLVWLKTARFIKIESYFGDRMFSKSDNKLKNTNRFKLQDLFKHLMKQQSLEEEIKQGFKLQLRSNGPNKSNNRL